MVDRKQLEAMITKAETFGSVDVIRDKTGYPTVFTVSGIDGIGPHPMGPIGFSEAMHRVGLGVGMNGREY